MRIDRVGILACLVTVTVTACGSVSSPAVDANVGDDDVDATVSFTVTVSKSGDGTGTITSSPSGIDCGSTCTGDFDAGTSVTLTATPSGSTFVGWSGGGCSGTGTCTIDVTADVAVAAEFAMPNSVVVTLAGTGAGTVTSTPAGINCPGDCSEAYTSVQNVTLTATISGDSTFVGWSGGNCSGTAPCTVSTASAVAVTATFSLNQYVLTVGRNGTGTGTVTSTPGTIDCGTTCTGTYDSGAQVTLTAAPASSSTFVGWSGGGCTNINPCVTTVTAAATVTATFDLQQIVLTAARTGTGTGAVTSSPAGISCGGACTASFAYGTTVTLSAASSTGNRFAGWSGGGCSGNSSCVVSLTDASTVTATFTSVISGAWDPVWSSAGVTFSNGDLSISGNSVNTKNVRGNVGKSAGKWYWEVRATGGNGTTNAGGLGIAESAMPNSVSWIGSAATGMSFGYNCCATTYFMSWVGASLPSGAPPANSGVNTGKVYMFALDMDTGRLWAGHDGTWYNAGNPAANTAPAMMGLSGVVYPGVTFYASSINAFTANFGGSSFAYAVPAGFNAGLYASPTTWDPAWSLAGVTYTNNNLSISGNSAGTKNVRTTIGRNRGKWYWEVVATGGNGTTNAGGLGIAESVMANSVSWIGSAASGLSFGYNCCATTYFMTWAGATLPSGGPPANSGVNTGTLYMFALDMNTGNFWAGQNGTWYNAGNPATNTAPAASGLTGTVFPGVTFYANSINSFTARFGPGGFTYAVPAGFQGGFF